MPQWNRTGKGLQDPLNPRGNWFGCLGCLGQLRMHLSGRFTANSTRCTCTVRLGCDVFVWCSVPRGYRQSSHDMMHAPRLVLHCNDFDRCAKCSSLFSFTPLGRPETMRPESSCLSHYIRVLEPNNEVRLFGHWQCSSCRRAKSHGSWSTSCNGASRGGSGSESHLRPLNGKSTHSKSARGKQVLLQPML